MSRQRDSFEAPNDRDLFQILKYSADTGNAFFRGLYLYGTWLPADAARRLVPLGWGITDPLTAGYRVHMFAVSAFVRVGFQSYKESYSALARISRERYLKLFRVKPKLHMLDHITCLF